MNRRVVRVVLALVTVAIGSLLFAACGSGDGTGIQTGLVPQIELQPGATEHVFDLSQVAVGEVAEYDFLIVNTGGANLSVEALAWTYAPSDAEAEVDAPALSCTYGPDATPCGSSSGLPTLVGPLNAGGDVPESLPVKVSFLRYDDDFYRQATLVIASNDAKSGDVVVTFSSGESAPRIQITPSRAQFEGVQKDTTDTRYVTILNTGAEDLIIDQMRMDADPSFSLVMDEETFVSDEDLLAGITIDPPIVLEALASKQLEVVFAPSSADPVTGSVEFHSNDPTSGWEELILEGNLLGPRLGLRPEEVHFGARIVGDAYQRTLTLVSAGTEDLVITGLRLTPDSSPDFELEDVPPTPEQPIVIEPGDEFVLHLLYTPDVVNEFDLQTGQPNLDVGTLVIDNNGFDPATEVLIDGFGVESDAPIPVITCEEGDEVIPQTMLHLSGESSYAIKPGATIARYQWSVEQPEGSRSILRPTEEFPAPVFEPNVAGTYTFYLDVWDSTDTKSDFTAAYEVVVIPDEAIHIELLWDTPGDFDQTDEGANAGADVDLHFIHPLAPSDPEAAVDDDGDGEPDPYCDKPYDCFWQNRTPDWAVEGPLSGDDPRLDRDDTDGAGPENVNLNDPEEDISYRVAAHYWDAHGYGMSKVTARIYIYEELREEWADVEMWQHDLWLVGFVSWPGGAVDFCTVQGEDGPEPCITTNYFPPMCNILP